MPSFLKKLEQLASHLRKEPTPKEKSLFKTFVVRKQAVEEVIQTFVLKITRRETLEQQARDDEAKAERAQNRAIKPSPKPRLNKKKPADALQEERERLANARQSIKNQLEIRKQSRKVLVAHQDNYLRDLLSKLNMPEDKIELVLANFQPKRDALLAKTAAALSDLDNLINLEQREEMRTAIKSNFKSEVSLALAEFVVDSSDLAPEEAGTLRSRVVNEFSTLDDNGLSASELLLGLAEFDSVSLDLEARQASILAELNSLPPQPNSSAPESDAEQNIARNP